MIEVLRKIWRFAGAEQNNIRKSMVLGFFYAIFHMFQIGIVKKTAHPTCPVMPPVLVLTATVSA